MKHKHYIMLVGHTLTAGFISLHAPDFWVPTQLCVYTVGVSGQPHIMIVIGGHVTLLKATG